MLRPLRYLPFILFSVSSTIAEESFPVIEFAPGAQGHIAPSIPQLLKHAEDLGAAWQGRLDIQDPDDFGVAPDLEDLRERALNNPRVRALLGADQSLASAAELDNRYDSKQAFLLVSFSMPPQSLRTMMAEAQRFGVPIIMQGFVENSIFKTQEALQSVFGDDADTVGFGIDPTIFTRFNVRVVPQFIITNEPLEVCETSGCAGDAPPPHDVVKGNVPIEYALKLIADGDGQTKQIAQALLEMGRK